MTGFSSFCYAHNPILMLAWIFFWGGGWGDGWFPKTRVDKLRNLSTHMLQQTQLWQWNAQKEVMPPSPSSVGGMVQLMYLLYSAWERLNHFYRCTPSRPPSSPPLSFLCATIHFLVLLNRIAFTKINRYQLEKKLL